MHRATAEHLPTFSVLGVGHLQILCCPGTGHLPTLGLYSQAFDMYTVSYQNITTQRILLKKKIILAHLSRTEGCKGMFSILCMHFFIAYQRESTFFG